MGPDIVAQKLPLGYQSFTAPLAQPGLQPGERATPAHQHNRDTVQRPGQVPPEYGGPLESQQTTGDHKQYETEMHQCHH